DPDVNLLKEDIVNVSVMVSMRRLLARMGGSSYARVMIKLWADVKLKDTIVVASLKLLRMDSIRVLFELSMSGNLPGVRVVRPVSKKDNVNTKKKGVESIKEVNNLNPFNVLNSVKNNADLGTNGLSSNLATNEPNSSGSLFWNVGSSSISTTPIVDKIDKFKKLIIDGKVTLVDNEGKPLKNVDYPGDHGNEDEVAQVDNEMASLLASDKVGYCTNSLLEQWRETYEHVDYDYDLYDDDMYKGQEIPDNIQSICDNLDIKL
nr:hypothetical protein [Tanacetum cinerariifolium]